MGIAADDGRLLVTNSRGEPAAAYRRTGAARFANDRPNVDPGLGRGFAGWGASWVDLKNTGKRDLVLTAGAIPVTNLAQDAEAVRVLAPERSRRAAGQHRDRCREPQGERPRPGRRGCVERRPRGDCDQHDRREARPAPADAFAGPLARCCADAFLAGRGRHGCLAERTPELERCARREQLPLVRGSAHPFRARLGDTRRAADRPLPFRGVHPACERAGRPRRHRPRPAGRTAHHTGGEQPPAHELLSHHTQPVDCTCVERRGRRVSPSRRRGGARAGARPVRPRARGASGVHTRGAGRP